MYLEVPKQLPNVDFRKLVKSTRDKDFKKEIYESQVQREIDWPAYNLSQSQEPLVIARFLEAARYRPVA